MASILSKPRVRLATSRDKDGYVHATRAGYELDLQFRWRYPYRHDFPDDAVEATGIQFDQALLNEKATVLVAEPPRLENGTEMIDENWIIVAGVVWEWKFLTEVEDEHPPIGFSGPTSGRRDMNPHRQRLFITAITAAEKHNLGPEWGPKRLELADCATDPTYHRRGAGRALVEWGLARAKEANVPVSLTASPMGRELYLRLGFRELDFFECEDGEGEEVVRTWVMVWTPEGWTR
ncbi:hypothetical protein FKW77_009145 [Venturia effusa]|uniref:N-acetyltransferase domain-containing protein n=1 Tax=Venturia effusa TaxID=50376 RepID=A0A517L3Z8_9PEZI|nr:hypothetical protein FKW77_009145 [Venturia effusa]